MTRWRRYIVALVRATRDHPDLELGASPRPTVALYRASQAAAVLASRSFVLPDDVKALVQPVLAHRLVVDLDRSLRGASASSILDADPGPRPGPADHRRTDRPMTIEGAVGIGLLLAGSFLGVPVAVVLGIVGLLFESSATCGLGAA